MTFRFARSLRVHSLLSHSRRDVSELLIASASRACVKLGLAVSEVGDRSKALADRLTCYAATLQHHASAPGHETFIRLIVRGASHRVSSHFALQPPSTHSWYNRGGQRGGLQP